MKKTTRFEPAQRLKELPPYVFAEIEAKKQALEAKGVKIIDLGRGDPDLSTPSHIIERLKERQQQAFETELRKEEQAVVDESATNRAARKLALRSRGGGLEQDFTMKRGSQ